MKILSPAMIRQLEKETMVRQGISSLALMERAGRAVLGELQQLAGECCHQFVVLCGFGNNGGDGLALARLLHLSGHDVKPYLLVNGRYSDENLVQQESLRRLNITIEPLEMTTALTLPPGAFIIDALFGHGLSRPLESAWKGIIQQLDVSPNPVFAIDVPSGLLADAPLPTDAPIVRATYTYTFACPKLTLTFPDYAPYTGQFSVLDIGLDKDIHATLSSDLFYMDKQDIAKLVKPLTKFSHKGTFGHVWVSGGRLGSIGAVVLASKAALKTGCGLVTAYIPSCGYQIMQTAFPEALTAVDPSSDIISTFPNDLGRYSAFCVGMGMGTDPQTREAFFQLLHTFHSAGGHGRLVLDADALNILSLHPEWHDLLPPESILTPHPKELQRLIGSWSNDFDKLEKVRSWCRHRRQIIVIKGANTAIVMPDGTVHINSTGNPGMATAGSGDVLSGILASLLAQGYEPKTAALIGVYLHGLSGDCAVGTVHEKSLIASDIIDHISVAWHHLTPGDHLRKNRI